MQKDKLKGFKNQHRRKDTRRSGGNTRISGGDTERSGGDKGRSVEI
jgi:hypothetical protein